MGPLSSEHPSGPAMGVARCVRVHSVVDRLWPTAKSRLLLCEAGKCLRQSRVRSTYVSEGAACVSRTSVTRKSPNIFNAPTWNVRKALATVRV